MALRALALILSLLSVGCLGEHVKITTTVYPDGSFHREVAFSGASSRDEFTLRGYVLPEGASWDIKEVRVPEGSVGPHEAQYVYIAKGHFQGPASDYAKTDPSDPTRLSRNELGIHISADACSYRETFRNTARREQLLQVHENFLRRYYEALGGHLTQTVWRQEHPEIAASMTQGVLVNMLGWHDQLLKLFDAMTDAETKRATMVWLDGESDFLISQIDRWWQEAGSWYPRQGTEEELEDALEEWGDSPAFKQLIASYEEENKPYVGAYGMYGMETVAFEVSIEMPSEITRTNAHTRDGRKASWSFTPMYFWLKDYTLEAVSLCNPPLADPS